MFRSGRRVVLTSGQKIDFHSKVCHAIPRFLCDRGAPKSYRYSVNVYPMVTRDVYTRDDSQPRFLAQHRVAALLRHCVNVYPMVTRDVYTRDDSQPRFLAQHRVAALLRHCFEWSQHCSNNATLCSAKTRRWESSRADITFRDWRCAALLRHRNRGTTSRN